MEQRLIPQYGWGVSEGVALHNTLNQQGEMATIPKRLNFNLQCPDLSNSLFSQQSLPPTFSLKLYCQQHNMFLKHKFLRTIQNKTVTFCPCPPRSYVQLSVEIFSITLVSSLHLNLVLLKILGQRHIGEKKFPRYNAKATGPICNGEFVPI